MHNDFIITFLIEILHIPYELIFVSGSRKKIIYDNLSMSYMSFLGKLEQKQDVCVLPESNQNAESENGGQDFQSCIPVTVWSF